MWIEKLPVIFDVTTEEEEAVATLCTKEVKRSLEDGFIYFNMDKIISFNDSSDGFVTLRAEDGMHLIQLGIEEFLAIIERGKRP